MLGELHRTWEVVLPVGLEVLGVPRRLVSQEQEEGQEVARWWEAEEQLQGPRLEVAVAPVALAVLAGQLAVGLPVDFGGQLVAG